MEAIKKVIIPSAGLGTRFLPLSKVVAKEMWPLVDRPVIEYLVEEAKNSGANHIIFVVKPGDDAICEYFKRTPSLEKFLKDRNKKEALEALGRVNELIKGIKLSFVEQNSPMGDGDAILRARRFTGRDSCGVLFADDIVLSKTACLAQLARVFKTCQRPVLAIKKVSGERIEKYGAVRVEKIASKLYKVKRLVEKPDFGAAPSDLAVVGKYIITQEVFEYLKVMRPGPRGEIGLAEAINQMVTDGGAVYGYEFDGEWLECGDKENWMKTNLRLSMENEELKNKMKELTKL